jgi:predicted aminopeptidase
MVTETSAYARTAEGAPHAGGICAVRALLMSLVLVALPGCGTLYIAQAARGQWEVLHDRRPIPAVLSDERTSATVRARLAAVTEARDFATQKLGLPDNKSYRSYADVGRTFVVWNVVAAPEFSVEPLQWCFPIAGCVAYRGYFAEHNADKFAAELKKRGFDVLVEGVPAYSTLGRFADPVLNTMLIYGDRELAAIIFHELAHQLIYVAGDSEFNEAFAVTVEETGLARWLEFKGRAAELEEYRAERAHDFEFNLLIAHRRAELAHLYASKLSPELMRARKEEQFAALAEDMRDLEHRQGVSSGYEEWVEEGLNNAHLASVATYFDCVPGFERLLAREDGDLPRFYAAVRVLAKKPEAERHRELCVRSAQGDQQARLAAPHLDHE